MGIIKKLKEFGLNTENRTYVIAEAGINHGGDIDTAKALIESAARSGADAIKFQTYITEKRVSKKKKEIFDILKKCELPFAAFGQLKQHAENNNIHFFSTAFDKESLDYLESIRTDVYKIASFDVVNQSLLKQIASTGKPVIMSTGMASVEEIRTAFNILKQGTKKICLLHCVSSYPLDPKDSDLSSIYKLQELFECVVGYSDHTPGIDIPLYAIAAGAQVIEQHFKIDDRMDCVDSPVSITENQMTEFVKNVRKIESIFGEGDLNTRDAEKPILEFRRENNR